MRTDRIPRGTELRGGLWWRLGRQVDGFWGVLAFVLSVVIFFLAPRDYGGVFCIPVVMISGSVASFFLLLAASAIMLLFYCFSGTMKPFHFVSHMLPGGPVELRSIVGLYLSFVIIWSILWRIRAKGMLRYRSAFLRTAAYSAAGATVGTILSLVLHRG